MPGHTTHGFYLTKINGLKHPFNQQKSVAGKKWPRTFLKRHPVLSMRNPEGIYATRVEGCRSENVARFFYFYESDLRNVNSQAHIIFSAGEIGFTAVQHRHSKLSA